MCKKALILKLLKLAGLMVLTSSPVFAEATAYELQGFNVHNVQKVLNSMVSDKEAVLTRGNGVSEDSVKKERQVLAQKTTAMRALTAENATLNHVKMNRDSVYLQLNF